LENGGGVDQRTRPTAHGPRFSALCLWTYNLGSGALQRSSLRRLYLNDGRYEEAADELLRWVFCNGKRLRGLVLRRTDERALFLA
jgi:lysozyme